MDELRAWIEIDVDRWRQNFALIRGDLSKRTRIAAVLKDEAYGHGAIMGARLVEEAGARFVAVVTIEEAESLRKSGLTMPILVLGQRLPGELEAAMELNVTCCLHDLELAEALSAQALRRRGKVRAHLEVDTGMSRYGVRWSEAVEFAQRVAALSGIELEGIMSHFAMSDELDKTFAHLQLSRFQKVLDDLAAHQIRPPLRHICNSGGFLDLPEAHFEMVRLGILPLGVYPSQSCRRIPGLAPVMSVKTRIVHLQNLQPGDKVGYGMRYTAPSARRIAVLPIGYGDGFPRVRNEGAVLIRGRRAPLVGGVSMDAITVDVTDIPGAQLWDEAIVMGNQGVESIDVHALAQLKKSVSYDVLANWRGRLKRVYIQRGQPTE